MNKEKGFSPLIILILVALIAGVLALTYYLATLEPTTSEASISESDEVNVLEVELNETTIDSFESDFESLDSDAASL